MIRISSLYLRKIPTVNGTTAYEKDYTVNNKNGTQQRKEVWIQKNNILYGIVLTAPNGVNVNLDSLVSSIKVNDSDDGPKYRGWAQSCIFQNSIKNGFSIHIH